MCKGVKVRRLLSASRAAGLVGQGDIWVVVASKFAHEHAPVVARSHIVPELLCRPLAGYPCQGAFRPERVYSTRRLAVPSKSYTWGVSYF